MFLPRKKETGYETIKRLQKGPVGAFEIVSITGEDAAKLLSENAEGDGNCRPTKPSDVMKIEKSIRGFGYDPYERPISFSELVRQDGTHRLTAIRNVGGTHQVGILIVPEGTAVKPYYDSGRKRDISDTASVNGVHLNNTQWATVNLFSAVFLGNSVEPHEKHKLYGSYKALFDFAFKNFKKLPKGRQHCFAVCWILSRLDVAGVSEATKDSLAQFALWLQENYEYVSDPKGGAVCVKLAKDFSEAGNHQTSKAQIVREIVRYSFGRKWETQKNRTISSDVVQKDTEKADKWIGGVK